MCEGAAAAGLRRGAWVGQGVGKRSAAAPALPSHATLPLLTLPPCCPLPPHPAVAFKQASGAACATTSLPKFTTAAVRKAVFAELNPAGVTVGGTFAKCSNQRSRLTQANSRVAEVVSLPCSGTTAGVAWATNKCDFDDFNGWAEAADAALAARGVDLSAYKYRCAQLKGGGVVAGRWQGFDCGSGWAAQQPAQQWGCSRQAAGKQAGSRPAARHSCSSNGTA